MFASLFYSFVLSQIFGLYLLITAILMLSRAAFYRQVIAKLKPTDGSIVLGASIGLLFGLALVDTHNIWDQYPRLLVTVVCWLILLKSVLWLSFTDGMLRLTKKLCQSRMYYVMTTVMLLLGIAMTSRGIIVFIQHHVMRLAH